MGVKAFRRTLRPSAYVIALAFTWLGCSEERKPAPLAVDEAATSTRPGRGIDIGDGGAGRARDEAPQANARVSSTSPAGSSSLYRDPDSTRVVVTFEGYRNYDFLGVIEGASFPEWQAILRMTVPAVPANTGDFIDEPSPFTTIFFLNPPPTTVPIVGSGRVLFDRPVREISFYYSTCSATCSRAFRLPILLDTLIIFGENGQVLSKQTLLDNIGQGTGNATYNKWDFVRVRFPENVIKSIKLVAYSNYLGLDNVSFTRLNHPPVANAGNAPYTVNERQPITLSAAGSSDPDGDAPLTYSWALGTLGSVTGVSPTVTYPRAGAYPVQVTVTDPNGASATANQVVTVINVPPTLQLAGPVSTLTNVPVIFTATVGDPGQEVSNVTWQVDGGAPQTGQPPVRNGSTLTSHISLMFTTFGSHTVRAEVTDLDGATVVQTWNILVNAPPVASFVLTTSTPTAGVPAQFDASASSDEENGPLTYTWNFGDGTGTFAGGPLISHTYATAGPFTVSLTVKDNAGATASTTTNIEVVLPAPFPVSMTVCPLTPVGTACSASASFGGGAAPYTATIDWGDGSPLQSAPAIGAGPVNVNGSHAYTAPGSYTVTITLVDALARTTSLQQLVNIFEPNNPPVAALASAAADQGSAVTIDASASTDPNGDTPLQYLFDFGDGSPVLVTQSSSASHVYASPGTYTAKVTVKDPGGLSSSATASVAIANVSPSLSVPANGATFRGTPFNFAGTATDPGSADAPFTLTIDWADGSPVQTSQIAAWSPTMPVAGSHTFGNVGTYDVSVTVADRHGASAQQTIRVAVANRDPVAVIAPASGTEGHAVALSGAGSSDPDGDALTYEWNFGDATAAASGANVSHVFAQSGSYTVSLKVTDALGAAHTATGVVTIANVPPVVSAGPDIAGTSGQTFTITANVTDVPADGPFTYTMVWGDATPNSIGNVPNPGSFALTHQCVATGTFNAVLTVVDRDGASSSDALTIHCDPIALSAGTVKIEPEVINLKGSDNAVITVKVAATAELDPAQVVISSVRLGDLQGTDTKPDTDRNGPRVDLKKKEVIAKFSRADLLDNGDLTTATTRLYITLRLSDGRVFQGFDTVRVK